MARPTRSEWQVNRQLAETHRLARSLPPACPALPLSRVLGWVGAGVLALLVIGEVVCMVS